MREIRDMSTPDRKILNVRILMNVWDVISESMWQDEFQFQIKRQSLGEKEF